MKKKLSLTLISLLFLNFAPDKNVKLLKSEAYKAYEYLNKVRRNPPLYSKKMRVNLSRVQKRHPLTWNEKLSRSAEKKAHDMAKRNYMGHFTPEGKGPAFFAEKEGYIFPASWAGSDKNNYIESISAGSSKSGIEHIINLIHDKGYPHQSPKANHRKHILGMNKFWRKHKDIGIGFAYNPETKYKGYLVIHTGIQGERSVLIKGKIYLPENYTSRKNLTLWVGVIDKRTDKKYWSQVTIPFGKRYQRYSIKAPAGSDYFLRYYKKFTSKKYIRGYYRKTKTVKTLSLAEILKVKNDNINTEDFYILPFN